ncbi:hypothetical protein KJ612_16370 [Myxococcota bacterium]|nr:hypothetical protein [Myxococcota bacterium]
MRLNHILFAIALFNLAFGCSGEAGVYEPTNNVNNANNTNNSNNVTNNLTCVDFDQDGYGDNCEPGDDCNDYEQDVNPGMPEICNDRDDNCDGRTDEDCPCNPGEVRICSSYRDPLTISPEMHCRTGYQTCEPTGWSDTCVGEVGPIDETCNGFDDDCDGDIDEGLLNAIGQCSGEIPPEDCGPTSEGNGVDENGDGDIDEGCSCVVPGYDPALPRTDQPCYGGPTYTLGVGVCRGGLRDCLGGVWGACVGDVTPSTELCDDRLDNDCDGLVDEGCPWCVNPLPEWCDGMDNDCDGLIDEGVRNGCGGCGTVGTTDFCDDGLDNNCNGVIDEGCDCDQTQACYPGPPETAGIGACAWGTKTCNEFSPCVGYVTPIPELCGSDNSGNGIDDDCDGFTDEGCICPEGATRLCGDGAGVCTYGHQLCTNNAWGACIGGTGPFTETCNGLDDDCDGLTDFGLLNACGTCGESCYLLPMDPTTEGTPDTGIETIPGGDPDNPTGADGITLTHASFIPPYLWAANETNYSVTKYNTDTMTQEGIYWVGNNPSRTAVDLDGNMWVGGRDDGRLTKVLWDATSCPEMNNGTAGIQTSSGTNQLNSAANPRADDCVAYSAVPSPSRPSIRGVAAGPDGMLWIGYTGGGVQAIDPTTFALSPLYTGLGNVPLYTPDANGVQQPTGAMGNANTVYGIVVDSAGFLYIAPMDDRTSFSVFDTNTRTWVGRFAGLCGSYGIALDGNGRIWFGSYTGCSGINMYDPAERKIYAFTIPTSVTTLSPGLTSGVTVISGNCWAQRIGATNMQNLGVGVEPATGDVWASLWNHGYTMRLHIDELNYANSTITYIGTLRDAGGAMLPGVSSTDLRGVGFDQHGYAWTLGLNSGRVWKLDPATNARAADLPAGQTIGVGTHYTYSDFTGSTALSFTAPRGFWTYIFSSLFEAAQVDAIAWDAYVPTGTAAGIRIRALDAFGNPASGWLPADIGGVAQYFEYPTGAPTHTIDLAANGGPLIGWSFEVNIRLATTDRAVRPIVNDVRLQWQRP